MLTGGRFSSRITPVHKGDEFVHFLFMELITWQALPEQRISQAAGRRRDGNL